MRLSSRSAFMSEGRCSPEPSRECSSMFLTIESARLPCWTIFSKLSFSVCVNSSTSLRVLPSRAAGVSRSFSSSISSAESAAKLLTKLSGFLISWAIPARKLPERGEFFRRHQPILRSAQFVKRGGELFGARLHLVEQANILDGDHGLVGECGDQFDLLVGKGSHVSTQQDKCANGMALAQKRDPEKCSGIAA